MTKITKKVAILMASILGVSLTAGTFGWVLSSKNNNDTKFNDGVSLSWFKKAPVYTSDLELVSTVFSQATEINNVKYLRFAVAVDVRRVNSVSITRIVEGQLDNKASFEKVYKGLEGNSGEGLYYNSITHKLTDVLSERDENFYFASYSIELTENYLEKSFKAVCDIVDTSKQCHQTAPLQTSYEIETSEYNIVNFLDENGKTLIEKHVINGNQVEPHSYDKKDFAGWYNDDILFDFNNPVESNLDLRAKIIHEFTEFVDYKVKPTCTKGGIAIYRCPNCGETKEIAVEPIGHNLIKHEEKSFKNGEAGNIEYYECKECQKYFKDQYGTEEIELSDTVMTDYFLSTVQKHSNFGAFTMLNPKNGSGSRSSEEQKSPASWFVLDDEDAIKPVYMEASVKLTNNSDWCDFGFAISGDGNTSADRIMRASLYVPSKDNHLATAVRFRTYNTADKVEKSTNLTSSINVAQNFVKIGMYRKGATVVFFVNGQIIAGNGTWENWSDATDESIVYRYGLFTQNIFDVEFTGAKILVGDDAVHFYESNRMLKKPMGGLTLYPTINGDSISVNKDAKAHYSAQIYTNEEEQAANTYVEATFKTNGKNNQYSLIGFMISKPGESKGQSLVAAAGFYLHNTNAVAGGFRVRERDTGNNKNVDANKLTGTLGIIDLESETAKLAIYRQGKSVKVYLNDQYVLLLNTWSYSGAGLDTSSDKFIYGIMSDNTSTLSVTDIRIKTGADADNAVKGLTNVGSINIDNKFGQYNVPNINFAGSFSVNQTTSTTNKAGIFDRRIVKSSVYFEASFQFSALRAWSQVGIEFVQSRSKDGKTTYSGTAAERLLIGLKHNANDTQGTFTRLVSRANSTTATTMDDQTIKDGLGFASNVKVKLAVYRNNNCVYAVINDKDVYLIPAANYSEWTDFADPNVGYNLGVYCDVSSAVATGTINEISMLTGTAADQKIQSLLPQA